LIRQISKYQTRQGRDDNGEYSSSLLLSYRHD